MKPRSMSDNTKHLEGNQAKSAMLFFAKGESEVIGIRSAARVLHRGLLWLLPVLGSTLLCACSTTPSTPGTDPGVQNLQVYADLDRKNGLWVVGHYCTTAPASARSPLSTCRATEMNSQESLYFDVATLKPFRGASELGCIDYSLVDQYPKRIQRCKDFESIYDASLNPFGMMGTAIKFVTTFGTTMARRWVLDESKFREAIETALPAPSRQAYLIQERDARRGKLKAEQDYAAAAPARQAAAEAAQQEAARQRLQDRRRFQTEKVRFAQAAQARFSSLATRPKSVGTTVCSADNRLGYVEQVAGPRIKVQIKGRAVVGRDRVYQDSDPKGPFDVDTSGLPVDWYSNPGWRNVEVPVLDSHFLFQPLQTIRIGPLNAGQIWDDGRYWGACDWRY